MNRNDPTDRFYFMPAVEIPLCNHCRHYDKFKCKAFPEEIPSDVIDRKFEQEKTRENLDESCNGIDDIHFEEKETE